MWVLLWSFSHSEVPLIPKWPSSTRNLVRTVHGGILRTSSTVNEWRSIGTLCNNKAFTYCSLSCKVTKWLISRGWERKWKWCIYKMSQQYCHPQDQDFWHPRISTQNILHKEIGLFLDFEFLTFGISGFCNFWLLEYLDFEFQAFWISGYWISGPYEASAFENDYF